MAIADLIHRKRSPFSYEEKAFMPLKGGGCSIVERLPIYVIRSPVSGLSLKKALDKGKYAPLIERFLLTIDY